MRPEIGIAADDRPGISIVPDEPFQHHFLEIRDSRHDHKLVTLIEIVSPSNKRQGSDREADAGWERELIDQAGFAMSP